MLGSCLIDLKFRNWGAVEVIEWVKASLIVNTVDSFQGQEADIVFVSTVRSLAGGQKEFSGLGFAKDQRRACVMLSRASQLLVVIGDAINMTTSQSEKDQLLLPRLSNWCSDNQSLFQIVESNLVPFNLPEISARSTSRSTIQTPQTISSPIGRPEQRALKLSTLEYIKLSNFAKRVVETLMDQPMFSLGLSKLADYIPRSERGEYKSLLLPVKKIPFVKLHQNHTEWIATIYCTHETALEIKLTNEFASDTLEMLERNNGTVLMSTISKKWPRSIRPLSSSTQLSKLLKLTLGSKVVVNHAFVQLSSDHNRVNHAASQSRSYQNLLFANAVETAMLSVGGRIKIDKLGMLFPASVRPFGRRHTLRSQVKTVLGSRVSLHGEYLVMNNETDTNLVTSMLSNMTV